MKKNKTLIISGISAIVIAAILFFTSKCDNTPTIDLNEAFAALELTNDSLQQEVATLATANEHLMVENKELEELNAQLSKLAQKKQKTRTVTKYVLTTKAKETIASQNDSINLYQVKLDSLVALAESLKQDSAVVNPVAMQEEINALQEALAFCITADPAYQHTFSDSFLYLNILAYPDSLKFQLGHEDILTAYQTEQRNGFLGLGKKTYNTYVTSQSPYSTVKDLMVYQRDERRRPFAIGLHVGFGPTWQPWDDANNFQFSADDVHLGIQAGVSLQYRLIKF